MRALRGRQWALPFVLFWAVAGCESSSEDGAGTTVLEPRPVSAEQKAACAAYAQASCAA